MVKKKEPSAAGLGRSGLQAPPPEPVAIGDAPPSNTASHGYKGNGDTGYRGLRIGVDSLYLSFYGNLLPAVDHDLAIAKYAAQSRDQTEQSQAQWSVGKHVFEVSDKGRQGFAYILRDNGYQIALRSGNSGRLPVAYVQVSSELLAHKPLEAVVEELQKVIEELAEAVQTAVVSRIDIYADFQTDTDIGALSREAWITQATGIDTYARKGKFTGWVFGASSILSARLYDKTAEIEQKSGKTFFHELWRRAAWDGSSTVWRLEFQFRREVLSQFRIWGFDQIKDKLGGLWLAAITSWLRLVVPDPSDSNRARWLLHPLWTHLSEIRWRLDDGPLTRSYTSARVPSLDRLYRMFTALLTSFMTVRGIKVYGEGVVALMESCREWHESWCRDKLEIEFDEWLAQKLALKAKQFNTRANKRGVRQDATTSEEAEKNGAAYYRQSRGE
jgi:hypothetical protein